MRRRFPLAGVLLLTTLLTVVAVACSGPASTLQTAGPGADRSRLLWFLMFGISCFVLLVVLVLLGNGLMRGRGADERTPPDVEDRGGHRYVLIGGVILPILALSALLVLTLVILRAQAREDDGSHAFTVDVIGHQWWWEIRYPQQGITTANELHIPTNAPVRLQITSDDVIHSLWVPRLQRKMDAIPGRTNILTLEADQAGVYRGECSEFCGLQHAQMRFLVIAEPRARFDAWVGDQQQVPPQPTSPTVLAGQQAFLGSSCVYCHTVGGTNATGTVGPNLTHIASRSELAAGSIPNTPEELQRWIADPASIKPGTQMPGSDLTARESRDLVEYLESLT